MSNLFTRLISDTVKVKTSQANKKVVLSVNAWETGVLLTVERDENNRLLATLQETGGSNNNKPIRLLYEDKVP
jgi:hypothetical protein